MDIVHKFIGQWGEIFKWSGSRARLYDTESQASVTETWLIGKAEGAENFALRYYEIGARGHSNRESHAHDHGILFLCGQGQVQLGDALHDVAQGDVVYIPPNAIHQIINTAETKLGFLCIIPARRSKQGQIVWAEQGLGDLTVVMDE